MELVNIISKCQIIGSAGAVHFFGEIKKLSCKSFCIGSYRISRLCVVECEYSSTSVCCILSLKY